MNSASRIPCAAAATQALMQVRAVMVGVDQVPDKDGAASGATGVEGV